MGCKLTISVHPSKSPPRTSKKDIVQNPVVGIADDTSPHKDEDQVSTGIFPDQDEDQVSTGVFPDQDEDQESTNIFPDVPSQISPDDDRYSMWKEKFLSARHIPPPEETKEWFPHK